MKMHRIAVSAFMGLVALVSASNVSAADVVDQSSDRDNAGFDSFANYVYAQSFKQKAPNISGAGMFFSKLAGESGYITISLWDDLPSVNSANRLAEASVLGVAGQWADVSWSSQNSSPISIASDTTYFLVFSSDSELAIYGDAYNDLASYNRGEMYYSDSLYNTYFLAPSPYGSADLMFRTFAVAAVPEPETYAMMLAGLGLLGLARRRKQKAA